MKLSKLGHPELWSAEAFEGEDAGAEDGATSGGHEDYGATVGGLGAGGGLREGVAALRAALGVGGGM